MAQGSQDRAVQNIQFNRGLWHIWKVVEHEITSQPITCISQFFGTCAQPMVVLLRRWHYPAYARVLVKQVRG